MLARGYADASPALLGPRVLRMGGQIFETVGRARFESTTGPDRAQTLRRRGERLQRVAADVCRVHGFDLRVEGVLTTKPCVLVANHVSYIDAIALASLAPCTIIAKGEVRGWPLIGAGCDALGILFVDRHDAWSGARALRRSLRALDAGMSVLGFPEGTTSSGEDVLPFRRGLFGLAQIADVPVVPIAIHYAAPELRWFGDSWFLPHYLRTAMRPRSLIHVRLGRPIAPGALRKPDHLADRVRSQIRTMLWRVRA
jgi:1-acyl-sn-glycerol-3-phosphate acyltransferase